MYIYIYTYLYVYSYIWYDALLQLSSLELIDPAETPGQALEPGFMGPEWIPASPRQKK